nr:hypothetical protein [uncultured Desulfobulbus sp.]
MQHIASNQFILQKAHHFTNKAELLQVLREKFEDTVMASIQALDQACLPDDWHGRIKAWIEGATHT